MAVECPRCRYTTFTFAPADTSSDPTTPRHHLIAAGADPKLVQAQLGHASIRITYDIYGHLFPDRLDELASDLDRLIREARQGRDQSRGMGRSL